MAHPVLFAYVAGAVVVRRALGRGAARHRLSRRFNRTSRSTTSSRCSARRSPPICSSGKPRRKPRTTGGPDAQPLKHAPSRRRGDRAHPLRHHSRHGLLERDRAVHHRQHRGDTARARRSPNPDLGPSGRGAAADAGRSPSRSSPPASSASACWRYRCWPAPAPMRSARRCAGASGWSASPEARAFYGTIAVATLRWAWR